MCRRKGFVTIYRSRYWELQAVDFIHKSKQGQTQRHKLARVSDISGLQIVKVGVRAGKLSVTTSFCATGRRPLWQCDNVATSPSLSAHKAVLRPEICDSYEWKTRFHEYPLSFLNKGCTSHQLETSTQTQLTSASRNLHLRSPASSTA
jgi:hypothetical protein